MVRTVPSFRSSLLVICLVGGVNGVHMLHIAISTSGRWSQRVSVGDGVRPSRVRWANAGKSGAGDGRRDRRACRGDNQFLADAQLIRRNQMVRVGDQFDLGRGV